MMLGLEAPQLPPDISSETGAKCRVLGSDTPRHSIRSQILESNSQFRNSQEYKSRNLCDLDAREVC